MLWKQDQWHNPPVPCFWKWCEKTKWTLRVLCPWPPNSSPLELHTKKGPSSLQWVLAPWSAAYCSFWKRPSCILYPLSSSFFFSHSLWQAFGILVPWQRVEPVTPAEEAQSSNPWTTRKVPTVNYFLPLRSCSKVSSMEPSLILWADVIPQHSHRPDFY